MSFRDNKINIKELASRLNVSVTTVSRVLNGKAKQYRIKEETEKKIKKTAEELNYAPNRFARSLKLDKSETIGVIVPDISNPFFAEIFKNIEKGFKKLGYAVFVGDSNDKTQQEIDLINQFVSRKVDGLVIAPVGLTSLHLTEVFNSGVPIVLIDRSFKDISLPAVTSNNYQGAFDATEELVRNGHRHVAIIQGIEKSQPNTDRVKGFTDVMKKWKIKNNEYSIVGNSFSIENGFRETNLLLQSPTPPTAIFALSNLIALGVLKAVSANHLSIPDDISLISFDEQTYSAYLNTPMTTIEQNKEQMGNMAVKLLIDQIEGKKEISNSTLQIETKIHIRKSIKKMYNIL